MFQTEEEAKGNERSPSVALLCAGLLRRGMVYELERVLRVCNEWDPYDDALTDADMLELLVLTVKMEKNYHEAILAVQVDPNFRMEVVPSRLDHLQALSAAKTS